MGGDRDGERGALTVGRLVLLGDSADFVRQIEPPAQGARRIATAIEMAVRGEPPGAAIALFANRA